MQPDPAFFERIVRDAGSIARERQGRVTAIRKAATDALSDAHAAEKEAFSVVDTLVQQHVLAAVLDTYPGMGVVAEESTPELTSLFPHRGTLPPDGWTIVLDPIDGTKNYLDGSPIWSVSLLVTEGRTPFLGCMYFPVLDVLILADRERTLVNGTRVSIKELPPFSSTDRVRLSRGAELDPALSAAFPRDGKELGCFTGAFLALLLGTTAPMQELAIAPYAAHIVENILLYDFGCASLAYASAGGCILDATFAPYAPLQDALDKNGVLVLPKRFFLAPTQEYARSMMAGR